MYIIFIEFNFEQFIQNFFLIELTDDIIRLPTTAITQRITYYIQEYNQGL